MTRDEFITWVKGRGYVDTGRGTRNIRFIHKDNKNKSFKLSKLAVRYEKRAGKVWVRILSNYLKRLTINDGKIEGLKR